MSEKSDDLQILKRFKDGDSTAFEEIVLKYQDRIYNLCRYMLGNAHDAEDAAQDTFIKAYQNQNRTRTRSIFWNRSPMSRHRKNFMSQSRLASLSIIV